MSFKNIFFKSEDDEEKTPPKVEVPVVHNVAPIASTFDFNTTPKPLVSTIPFDSSNDHFVKTLEIYESGFEKLNQPGYDFYEFFKAVSAGGISNPSSYNMAYGMGIAMDKTINKEKLISQSDFYLTEIAKVHTDFKTKGNAKHEQIINEKRVENETLVNELNSLKSQMEQLQVQINDRERKLSIIDTKYDTIINEVVGKLNANDKVKDTFINSITEVKNGISTNIK